VYSTFTATSAYQYTSVYTIAAGDATTSKCGTYTLSNFMLIQGGLEGKYYTNRWFSGTEFLVRTDSQVNFNWGEGELIEGVSSNYVSAEWNGFLLPQFTESFTFEVHSNDGVRVWVN